MPVYNYICFISETCTQIPFKVSKGERFAFKKKCNQ